MTESVLVWSSFFVVPTVEIRYRGERVSFISSCWLVPSSSWPASGAPARPSCIQPRLMHSSSSQYDCQLIKINCSICVSYDFLPLIIFSKNILMYWLESCFFFAKNYGYHEIMNLRRTILSSCLLNRNSSARWSV